MMMMLCHMLLTKNKNNGLTLHYLLFEFEPYVLELIPLKILVSL